MTALLVIRDTDKPVSSNALTLILFPVSVWMSSCAVISSEGDSLLIEQLLSRSAELTEASTGVADDGVSAGGCVLAGGLLFSYEAGNGGVLHILASSSRVTIFGPERQLVHTFEQFSN